MNSCPERVLVVGAGPAGLALGYELQKRHIAYQILERERVGWAWHNHYDRLHLHTLKSVSGLPGLPMPADYPRFPARHQVAEYFAHYAQHFDLNIATNVMVEQASWDDPQQCWQLTTSQGPICGTTLVMATGIWSTPHQPQVAGLETYQGTVLHAQAYRNPQPFVGQRVLVVGVGNTGAEIAVDLASAGVNTTIAIRSGVTLVPRPASTIMVKALAFLFRHLPRSLANSLLRRFRRSFQALGLPDRPVDPIDAYPVVGFELTEAVQQGLVTVIGAISHFTAQGIVLNDQTRHSFNAVLFATGYRPSLKPVQDYLDFDSRGWPLLDRWQALRYADLYCLGFFYPTTEGWLQAIGRAAREVADSIAIQQHQRASDSSAQ